MLYAFMFPILLLDVKVDGRKTKITPKNIIPLRKVLGELGM
jgi:hypothetical protein